MQDIERAIAQTRKRLKTIDPGREPAADGPEREYFTYYGIDLPGARHAFGLLRTKRSDLALHVLRPRPYRATVVLVHGYLEHGAYFRHAARRLLAEGYAVVLFDLPGHGLSSGSFATVRDFSEYAAAVDRVVRFAEKTLRKPVHLVGHSMGCSAIVELLLTKKAAAVRRVVLVAPLVHPAHWALTKAACSLFSRVVAKVPRMFPVHSSDREFMLFTLFKDPLLRKKIPVPWVHAMLRWNRRLEAYPASPKEVLMVQGTGDTIVDGKFNIAFLRKKFPNARTYLIERANHQLFNEAAPYRNKALNAIVRYLSGKTHGLSPKKAR